MLLDRADALERLGRVVERARCGAGDLVLLEGDAGIGKTALVGAVRAMAAARGVTTLVARGAELETDLAFGTVRDLLAATGPAPADGAAALASTALDPTGADGNRDLFASLHGLYWLVVGLSDRGPLVLVVDDAQWCDVPSLRFLAYLAHRLDGLPVSLVAAARPATDPVRADLLAALAAEPQADVVRPAPLGPDAVRELVTRRLGDADPTFVAACRTVTGGNPFLLGELLAELSDRRVEPRSAEVPRLVDAVPHEVERSVRQRLARLGPDAAGLARAAAVLADDADPRHAVVLAGIDDLRAVAAADLLVEARLLNRGPRLTFRHPLVRSAVEGTFGPAELAAAHRRAAELLAADAAPEDTVVAHLMAARPCGDAWVVRTLRAAAGRAAKRGAPEAAAGYLRRAMAEPPAPEERPGLLVEMGAAEVWAGDARATATLTAAVDRAPDPTSRARAARMLGRRLFDSGRIADGVAVYERALDGLADPTDPLALELEAELVITAMQQPDSFPVGRRRLEDRPALPAPDGRPACMVLASAATEEMLLTRSRARAVELADRSLTGGHLLDEPELIAVTGSLYTLAHSGHPERARRAWDVILRRQGERGSMPGTAGALVFRGYATYLDGDVSAAVEDLTIGLDMARGMGIALQTGFATAWLVHALLDAGQIDDAEAAAVAEEPLLSGPLFAAAVLLAARARLRVAQGRPGEALDDLDDCTRRLAGWGSGDPAPCPWRATRTHALHALGDVDAARAEGARAVRSARAWGAPHTLSDALVAAAAAEPEGAAALLDEAVAVAADAPLHRARALVARGVAAHRAGARRAARADLRDGLDLALSCGAMAVATRAHDELVVSGARPRRLRSTGADSLTPTERRVAGMAADGLTNRAVAQVLFVSEKTVETHLGHAYRKLGIAARSQLPAALRPRPARAAATAGPAGPR